MCLHLVVAQFIDGIHATLLNAACLPSSCISCSMLTFAIFVQLLCSVAAEVFSRLRVSVCNYGLSIAPPVFHLGRGTKVHQSRSQNHKKYPLPRRGPKTLAINFQGTEPSEISQANTPKQTSQTNGRSQSRGPKPKIQNEACQANLLE